MKYYLGHCDHSKQTNKQTSIKPGFMLKNLEKVNGSIVAK